MDFLHRSNILHRDLKPDNILMVSLEVRSSVICKISDFGTTRDINRFASEMHFTKGVGTPIFMAPEMLKGTSSYEKSADVYSFALMMVNLANDKIPFEDDPHIKSSWQFATLVIEQNKRPQILVPLPDDFAALMKQCWSPIPNERPAFSDIVSKIEAMFKKELNSPQRK
jgi:serine/threonine protein kinase